MRIAIIASGRSAPLVSKVTEGFDLIIWSNPMRFPNLSIIRFLRKACRNGAELWTMNNTNGVEPHPIIGRLFSPKISLQTRHISHTVKHADGQTCGMVRSMTRVGKMARRHNPTSLDQFLECSLAYRLMKKSTGLVAAQIAANMSDSVHLFGFDFYQGKPANFTYHFDLFPFTTSRSMLQKQEMEKNLISFFETEFLALNPSTTFYLYRKNAGEQRYERDPQPSANLAYR